MEYIKNTLDFHVDRPTVITFGKFDGLHRGHELLMEELLAQASQNDYQSVVFTFDIPPKKRTAGAESRVIITNEEKHFIFEKTGVNYLIECPFTPEVMQMEAEAFIAWITGALHAKCIVVGTDFCFGYKRSGNASVLKAFEKKYGYHTIVLEKIQEEGRDISSTYIREELLAGHIEKANHLLGYDFFLMSKVVHGNQIGRKMGIPTINMKPADEKILPPFGVYATRVLIGEKWYMGVSNVGMKPTVGENQPVGVETYILDFCQNVYDETMIVEFLFFLRPEKKFASLTLLQEQIADDIAKTKSYYRNIT